MTPFTFTTSPCHDAGLDRLPPCAIGGGITPVSRMCLPDIILRLVNSHTDSIAKSRLAMKITGGAGNFLAATIAGFSDQIRSTRIGFSSFAFTMTLLRTVNLVSPLAINQDTTDRAKAGRMFLAPPTFQIAIGRTIFLVRSAIKRMKTVLAESASTSFICLSHVVNYIIQRTIAQEISEEYCRIAVKRLRQNVFDFEKGESDA